MEDESPCHPVPILMEITILKMRDMFQKVEESWKEVSEAARWRWDGGAQAYSVCGRTDQPVVQPTCGLWADVHVSFIQRLHGMYVSSHTGERTVQGEGEPPRSEPACEAGVLAYLFALHQPYILDGGVHAEDGGVAEACGRQELLREDVRAPKPYLSRFTRSLTTPHSNFRSPLHFWHLCLHPCLHLHLHLALFSQEPDQIWTRSLL